MEAKNLTYLLKFQSTCPARGTTIGATSDICRSWISIHVPREGHDVLHIEKDLYRRNFNPRAPRGARLILYDECIPEKHISIHVPREGHDFLRPCRLYPRINFNPRAPRGARRRLWERVEVDVYFNPRAPRGARLDPLHKRFKVCRFQSTCPARGTTHKFGAIKNDLPISIHVPREGHDCI